MIDIDVLRDARTAVVGLQATIGRPPLIVETVVYHVDGGRIGGGPFSYASTVDAPRREVPPGCWPHLSEAPTWSETAGRLVEVIADRVLVLHERCRWEILRHHLPDWQPAGVVLTGEMASRVWPGLDNYSLGAISSRAGIPGIMPGAPHSALVESQVVALVLIRLLVELGQTSMAQAVNGSGRGRADPRSARR